MIELRSATLGDIELINSLADTIFRYTYKSILSPQQIDFMFEMMYSPENIERQMSLAHHYFIALKDGEACGYLSIRELAAAHFYIEKIYTLPSVHGSGVARRLFEFACDYAISNSQSQKTLLELNVNRQNERAIGFYKKMGMHADRRTDEHVGNGYYANDYVMAIELSSR